MSRYDRRLVASNAHPDYDELLEKRGVRVINQYRTTVMSYPTDEERESFQVLPYVWKVGDMYWKLAAKFYNDPKLWWVIAWYNKTPTEADINFGDQILIPTPLGRILQLLR